MASLGLSLNQWGSTLLSHQGWSHLCPEKPLYRHSTVITRVSWPFLSCLVLTGVGL